MSDTDGAPQRAEVALFTQLLATCQRSVFLYALGLLHNAADAEEVLQETNLRLWQKFDKYQPGTNFKRWACRIAHYEVLKLREKRGSEERLFSDKFIEVLASEWDRRFDEVDVRRQALDKCLEKLSTSDRDLVMCRYQPGGTTRSVAEAFGRSVQGTRKRLHWIRTNLLGCIRRNLAAEERNESSRRLA